MPRPTLERQPTERDRLIDSVNFQRERERERERERQIERNLSLERERQIEMAQSRSTTSDTYDTGLREQPSTLAQRDLIATVLDMKVDVRLEMQRMAQRMTKIEELLADLGSKLAVESGQSSPGQEDVPSVNVVPSASTSTTINVPSSNPNPGTSSGGNGLGPILLRKRRSKSRKAPAPPKQSPEQTRLLEVDLPPSTARKKEFL